MKKTLAGIVAVGCATAFPALADNITNTIIGWNAGSATAVSVRTSATSSYTSSAGTEIKATAYSLSSPVDNQGNSLPAAYLTFDFKSTGANTGAGSTVNQNFEGSFSIADAAANGNVLVAGGDVLANIAALAGATSVTLNTTVVSDLTGSLVTGGNFSSPFELGLSFYTLSGFGKTTVNGTSTTVFTSAKVDAGDVLTVAAPEPSTLALAGAGIAGMMAARRRK